MSASFVLSTALPVIVTTPLPAVCASPLNSTPEGESTPALTRRNPVPVGVDPLVGVTGTHF